jgi:Flp pilus assembly pilin Flp
MGDMMNAYAFILRDDAGATMVEYAIMLAFIAAICITLIAALGGSTMNEFFTVSSVWADPK